MDIDETPRPPLNLNTIFSDSFAMYRNNYPLLLGLGLIYGLANVSDGILFAVLKINSFPIFLIVNFLISAVASMTLIYAAERIFHNQPVDYKEALLSIRGKYLRYLGATLILSFIVLVGIMMFVIPGLYLATIFVFVDILIVIENRRVEEVFRRSPMHVKGYFGTTFLYFMIISIFLLVPGLAAQSMLQTHAHLAKAINLVLGVVIFPFYNVSQVIYYFRLKEVNPVIFPEDEGL